jgi:tetratricopeptide (TPR) repeat protein
VADSHLDADTLAAYIDGRLAAGELGTVDRHIDACGTCRRELSSLAALQSQPPAAIAEIPEGTLGRYHILRELGHGSMGIVLRAYDPELARAVAIKLVRDDTRELVRGEARALAKLRHPNVVTVYDVIVDGERMYIAMELVEGDTLRGYCKDRPWREVLAACVRAGRGLAAAHDAGVIHRDFKPENVLCTAEGEARVSDFGLAAAADDAQLVGAIVGTPAYMAPEVARGEPASAASDQYSFCVTTYEMLVGRRPNGEPAPLAGWLARVLERGLASEPAARYPSLAALVAELENDPQTRRRRRVLVGAGALAALATGALAVRLATPAQPSCAIDVRALGDAWDASRKRAVSAALTAAVGDELASKTVGALDEYAAVWLAGRIDACEATRVRGEQTEAVLDRRVACLDRGRRELGELSRVLATADAKVGGAAREAVAKLRDPAACSTSADSVPDDPLSRLIVDQGRALLDRANALDYVGKYDEAEGLARQVAMPQLIGEALYVRARVEIDRTHHEKAESMLFDALEAAERAHDDVLVATIWVDLVMTVGAQQHRFEVARSDARAADAALARITPSAELQLHYEYTLGGMLSAHGDLAAARDHLVKARAIADADPRRAAIAGLVHVSLCDVERQLGDIPAARGDCTKGLALLEGALGREHLRVAVELNTVAVLEFSAHDLDAAERDYLRAIEIFERRNSRDHLVYALALSNLGALYAERDDPALARPEFERALAMFDQYRPKHPQRQMPLQGLASLALRSGDAESAIRYYGQVRDAMAATYTPDSPTRLVVEFDLALSYRDAKQLARAQEVLDPMIARTLTPGKEQWTLAARALDLSANIASDRHDEAAALALIERALAAIGHVDDKDTHALLQRRLGEIHLRMKHPDLALPPLEQATAYFMAHSDDSYDIGTADFLLAKALWESGGDRSRAIVLAQQAAGDLAKAKSGDDLAVFRADIAKFLKSHGN